MKYDMSRGALQLLQSSLAAPGWTTNVQDLYSGGSVAKRINDLFLGLESLDRHIAGIEDDEERHRSTLEWFDIREVFELVNRELMLIRACIDYHVEHRQIAPNPAFVDMCETLGLVD